LLLRDKKCPYTGQKELTMDLKRPIERKIARKIPCIFNILPLLWEMGRGRRRFGTDYAE
jgi:hypothetical protein